MEDPPRREPPHDRITRAVTRINVATARVSQAEAVLTAALQCLALAQLALKDAWVQDVHIPSRDDT